MRFAGSGTGGGLTHGKVPSKGWGYDEVVKQKKEFQYPPPPDSGMNPGLMAYVGRSRDGLQDCFDGANLGVGKKGRRKPADTDMQVIGSDRGDHGYREIAGEDVISEDRGSRTRRLVDEKNLAQQKQNKGVRDFERAQDAGKRLNKKGGDGMLRVKVNDDGSAGV